MDHHGPPCGARKTAVITTLTAPLHLWEKLNADRMRPDSCVTSLSAKWRAKDRKPAGCSESRIGRKAAQYSKRKSGGCARKQYRDFPATTNHDRSRQSACSKCSWRTTNGVATDRRRRNTRNYGGAVFQGHSAGCRAGSPGTPMRIDRMGRWAHIDRPAFCCGLAIQPDVLAEAVKLPRLRDVGLLARFLYAMPPSMDGETCANGTLSPRRSSAAWRIRFLLRKIAQQDIAQGNQPLNFFSVRDR